MFSWFNSNSGEKKPTPPSAPNPPSTFTPFNQANYLTAVGESTDQGRCAQLSNMFVRDQMQGRPTFLTETPQKIDAQVKKEKQLQQALTEKKSDPLHSGFAGTNHTTIKVSKDTMTDPAGIENLFKDKEHALVTYPVNEQYDLHQIAVGKNPQQPNQCYWFNANFGAKHASCPEIYSDVAKMLELEARSKAVILGSTSSSSKKT